VGRGGWILDSVEKRGLVPVDRKIAGFSEGDETRERERFNDKCCEVRERE